MSGTPCPRCKKGVLKIRQGKYGLFVGCSRYPHCKYSAPLDKGKQHDSRNDTGEWYEDLMWHQEY